MIGSIPPVVGMLIASSRHVWLITIGIGDDANSRFVSFENVWRIAKTETVNMSHQPNRMQFQAIDLVSYMLLSPFLLLVTI